MHMAQVTLPVHSHRSEEALLPCGSPNLVWRSLCWLVEVEGYAHQAPPLAYLVQNMSSFLYHPHLHNGSDEV